MNSLLPEKPILLYPSLIATIGLEEAIMLSILDEMGRYATLASGSNRHSETGNQYRWFRLGAEQLRSRIPFWEDNDIQRITQRLRDLGLILLRSAPFVQSQAVEFAFNHRQQQNCNRVEHTATTVQRGSPVAAPEGRASFTAIAPQWQPDRETLIAVSQLNIPEHFAREQVPEFVRYWCESGQTQRSWGSKFIQYVKRQWTFHATRMARRGKASSLPHNWQPGEELQAQIAAEGVPATFSQKVLKRFRCYHQTSGTTHVNWDMPFFSWVKEEWRKQDTPFIESRKSTPMYPEWQPDQHTMDYLTGISCNIDRDFVRECVPEFIHKWTEKNAVFSEWGNVFARHVSEQWQFVQAGIKRNPEPQPINKQWRPSADCLDILQVQLGVDGDFIEARLPEFILYWANRAEPMHSWDNIFLRHIKRQWALAHPVNNTGEGNNERYQNGNESRSSRDISLEERLTDRSWAN